MSRPLVYQWIAHYNDGTGFYQYDPYNYKENKFVDINKEKLIKFGLYPYKRDFAKNLREKGINVVSLELLPVYEINLEKNERIIHYRDVFISQETFHICKNCKKEFKYQTINSTPIKLKDNKLGIKRNEAVPICPHCKERDHYICRQCGKRFDTYNDASYGMCPDCGREKGYLKRVNLTSGTHSKERRWIEYYLGKQNTIKGTNVKFLMKIRENGDCIIL